MGAVIGTDLGTKKPVDIPFKAFNKHFIALGSSGSGKTVFCKALIEEAARNKIPCIILDPQGDIASLALPNDEKTVIEKGLDPKMLEDYKKNVRVVIFTPTSEKGVPLCVNPLRNPGKVEGEELISIANQIAYSVCRLLGYDLDSDRGKGAQSLIYLILHHVWSQGDELKTFDKLAELVKDPPLEVKSEAEGLLSDKEVADLIRKIKYLTIGEKELLFQFGVPLDIDILLGKGQNKTQISIIYLNTIETKEEKEFFISVLCTFLYQWMLFNPSNEVQAIFYIDEISQYIPPDPYKPITKEILKLLFKQARKYGISCMTCTQNPGDIDYKSFSQFSTWAIGRLTTKQDISKVQTALKSVAGPRLKQVMDKIPSLKPGEFALFAPDVFDKVVSLKTRWLLTQHFTMDEEYVRNITTDETRKLFSKYYSKKPELAEIPKGPQAKISHLPVNFSREKVAEIIESKKKKLLVLVGPATENLESLDLLMVPLYQTSVKHIEKKLFGLKEGIGQVSIYFNGINGDIVKLGDLYFKQLKGISKLSFELGDADRAVLKLLLQSKSGMTSAEISTKLGLADSTVDQVLNELKEYKMVTNVGKAGRAYMWSLIVKIEIPTDIGRISSTPVSTDRTTVEDAKEPAPRVDQKTLSKILKAWFPSAEIVDAQIIHYPVYRAVLVKGEERREVFISAVTGGEVDIQV